MTTRFHALLEAKVEEAIKNYSTDLCAGTAADYPKYREGVGYLRGLVDSLKLCDEVEQDLGNERGDPT